MQKESHIPVPKEFLNRPTVDIPAESKDIYYALFITRMDQMERDIQILVDFEEGLLARGRVGDAQVAAKARALLATNKRFFVEKHEEKRKHS